MCLMPLVETVSSEAEPISEIYFIVMEISYTDFGCRTADGRKWYMLPKSLAAWWLFSKLKYPSRPSVSNDGTVLVEFKLGGRWTYWVHRLRKNWWKLWGIWCCAWGGSKVATPFLYFDREVKGRERERELFFCCILLGKANTTKKWGYPSIFKTPRIALKSGGIGSKFLSQRFFSRRFKPLAFKCGDRVARTCTSTFQKR